MQDDGSWRRGNPSSKGAIPSPGLCKPKPSTVNPVADPLQERRKALEANVQAAQWCHDQTRIALEGAEGALYLFELLNGDLN